MHLLIGSLLSLLLSKNPLQPKADKPRLSYMGIIEVKHALPGRIRYRIPKLAATKMNTTNIKQQLLKIPGIRSVEFNALSGSALVLYNESEIETIYIFAALVKLFDLEKEMQKPTESVVGKEVLDISSALNRVTYEYTRGFLDLKTVIPLMFLGSALYQIFIKRNIALPGGFTFLWWAYAMMSKQFNK